MNRHARFALLATVLVLWAAARAAEPVAGEAHPPPGLAVGATAPDFMLVDQTGRTISLKDLLGRGPVAVVFFRSANGCGDCKLQLVQLHNHMPQITALGAQLVAISDDKPEILRRFGAGRIAYPLLSDVDSATIDAWGFRNPDAASGPNGTARPGTLILDREGRVHGRLPDVSYAEREGVDALLAALAAADAPAGESVLAPALDDRQ